MNPQTHDLFFNDPLFQKTTSYTDDDLVPNEKKYFDLEEEVFDFADTLKLDSDTESVNEVQSRKNYKLEN